MSLITAISLMSHNLFTEEDAIASNVRFSAYSFDSTSLAIELYIFPTLPIRINL